MNSKATRIVFCISPHGYGHAAQTSSVINRLLELTPDLEVYVKTTLPESFIKERFNKKIHHIPQLIDFGMIMKSSIDILAKESWLKYKDIHDQWEKLVEKESQDLIELQPQLIVSNVAYLCLEAAKRLNIPSLAMGSLNWADIFAHYCSDYPDADSITAQIQSAYNHADTFIQLFPCLPMLWLNNKRSISPVTQLGKNMRTQINQQFNLPQTKQLVLIGMGGISMRLPIESWPKRSNTLWVIPDEWGNQRQDCIALSQLGLPFIDILASVDALITKPGYGTFSEAVCNGIPFLFVPRGDWPEEPYLENWAKKHGIAESISRESLYKGTFYSSLTYLLSKDKNLITPPKANGANEAAQIILSLLNQQCG